MFASHTFKRGIGKLWPQHSSHRKLILLYHAISDHPWAISKAVFTQQINWLQDHCEVVSLSKLLQSSTHQRQVAITFDDGYASVYDNALPILHEKNISPLIYLNTGWIGHQNRKRAHERFGHYESEYFLTWTEVQRLSECTWDIGSHAINHFDFSKLDGQMMAKELSHSKEVIEAQIRRPCLHFSYPWGKYTKKAAQAVQDAGYQSAVSVRHAPVRSDSPLFALPRINIARHYSFKDFKTIMIGKWDYLNLIHKFKGL